MDNCLHLDWVEEVCPECKEQVDCYGNTESAFKYCCFPDCGCDGARLCMAGEASDRAIEQNVEGMWLRKTRAGQQAIGALVASVAKEKK